MPISKQSTKWKYQGLFEESKGVYKWSVQDTLHSQAAPGNAPGLITNAQSSGVRRNIVTLPAISTLLYISQIAAGKLIVITLEICGGTKLYPETVG